MQLVHDVNATVIVGPLCCHGAANWLLFLLNMFSFSLQIYRSKVEWLDIVYANIYLFNTLILKNAKDAYWKCRREAVNAIMQDLACINLQKIKN